ncbi:putative CoA-binding protein [Sterolibacterium denitrificans]|uniref:CoA-binding protein n=1 Tax=Sterolibacterium denitrificans TaxID=157592 RepID=A0A7Z7HP78_9PROT|nr:CoA-binding protein [Sterolibacterium denitrificans]SMB22124.1 putative CoA-binding protein [Sterolibacterium denitrificans]
MIIRTDDELRRILRDNRVIAVVGLSANPARPSNAVARYLMAHGYSVIPVNPAETEILGQPCYPDLASIPQPVDIVDCFRKSEDTPPLAQAAVAIGAKVLWLQLGVSNETAAQTASAGGLAVVMDRCVEIEHARLLS